MRHSAAFLFAPGSVTRSVAGVSDPRTEVPGTEVTRTEVPGTEVPGLIVQPGLIEAGYKNSLT
jgi:hypothetical protein